jgi:uncharacterized protein (DUF488 family)
MTLFTIGHSNHALDKLAGLLKRHGVATLVDVRTAPYSRYSSQFNKESLGRELGHYGLAYVFEGDCLGGRPSDPACYRSGTVPDENADYLHEVDYREVMKRPWFVRGVDRLLDMAGREPTAVMCSEEDPAHCHRHHLIAAYLAAEHPEVDVRHIRGDGTLQDARAIPVNGPIHRQLPLF